MTRRTALIAALALAAARPAAAQGMAAQAGGGAMPESYRQVQLSALELQRRVLLTMADSMPENLYRDKVTPVQRDFAQQLHHTASAMAFILARVGGAAPAAGLPDTSTAFNSRAGLKAYVNGVYDYAANVLRTQTAADRAGMVNLFGHQIPRWQLWDELHQHAFWTTGQVVANFRKHGMAPPGFGFF